MQFFSTKSRAKVLIHFDKTPETFSVYLNNELYYFRKLNGQKKIKFNVCHAGNYKMDGGVFSFELLPFTLSATLDKLPPLPAKERNKDATLSEVFAAIKIQPGDFNNCPARIWAQRGLIETSTSFSTLPAAIRFFILLHETGHIFYKTEWKCDLFALHEFLKAGYNESTAMYALTQLLGNKPEHEQRINSLFKIITQ